MPVILGRFTVVISFALKSRQRVKNSSTSTPVKALSNIPESNSKNLCFKAEISYLPPKHDFLDFRKVQMRNWTQYSGRVNSVRVHINLAKKPSAEFFASNVDGDSISEVSNAANQECLLASIELCNLTGIKFGPLKQAGKPEYAIYDPIAREYCKEFGQVTVEGLGKLNASKPRRIGEFEFYDPRSAAQYMQMPQQIESIQRTLNDLGVKIDCVEKAVAGHNPQGESVVRHETIAEKKIFSEWQRQSPTLNIRFDSNTVFGSPHLGLRDILLGQLCNSNGKYFAENVEVRESHHP